MISETQRDKLIAAATAVRENAYAPYSNYKVGAALLTEDGRIFTGANVENASYGLTVCAERNAIGKMVAEGVGKITAVAVVTENGGSPCGACRQVLVEFGADVPVWLCDLAGNIHTTTLYTLIPNHFGPDHLT